MEEFDAEKRAYHKNSICQSSSKKLFLIVLNRFKRALYRLDDRLKKEIY